MSLNLVVVVYRQGLASRDNQVVSLQQIIDNKYFYYSNCFIYVNAFNACLTSVRVGPHLIPFYSWGDGGTVRLSSMCKVTQLAGG